MLPSRGRDPYTNAPLSFSRIFSQRGRSASGGGGGGEEGDDGREGGGNASEVEGVSGDNEHQQQQMQKQGQHQESDIVEGHRGLFKHVSLLPRRHSPSLTKAVPRSVSHTCFEHGWQGKSDNCCGVESIPEDALEMSLPFSTREGSMPKQVSAMEAKFSALRSCNERAQGVS